MHAELSKMSRRHLSSQRKLYIAFINTRYPPTLQFNIRKTFLARESSDAIGIESGGAANSMQIKKPEGRARAEKEREREREEERTRARRFQVIVQHSCIATKYYKHVDTDMQR